ncbi:hypothetical protein Q5P01_011803 [Channa striata]|uniref:Secreted protein n=1 Tax=Channa striata TaxID=64152 RepID=A0AA88SW15_CHASR|nr:hypothetical protein Q5P01_011803 [Channa striata]
MCCPPPPASFCFLNFRFPHISCWVCCVVASALDTCPTFICTDVGQTLWTGTCFAGSPTHCGPPADQVVRSGGPPRSLGLFRLKRNIETNRKLTETG